MPATLKNPQIIYAHGDLTVYLHARRYNLNARNTLATLRDDGIVDPVAVDRAVTGDSTVRLTPREFVCVVARLAGNGASDPDIAATLGFPDVDIIRILRTRNGIPTPEHVPDGDDAALLILEPAARLRRPASTLRAAGLSESVIEHVETVRAA